MKKITYWILSSVAVLVLLFSYHTSTAGALATSSETLQAPVVASSGATAGTNPPEDSSPDSTGSDSGSTSSGGSGSSGSSDSAGSGSTSTGSTTATGDTVQTRWGPVQVQLTISNGAITDVSVLQYPYSNPKDQQINNYALPILIQETLDAQSANIDMIGGATVTSVGYQQSLQSALDQANL